MPVFISHKKEDAPSAILVHRHLTSRSIKCYLDVLDPATQNTEDITKLVLSRLNICTHLMAILSNKSKDSWWIPFEVGAASNAHHRICSYKIENIVEPEYLTKWPILNNPSHLDKFVTLYNSESVIVNEALRKSHVAGILKEDGASKFHNSLKSYVKYGY